jgi:hypothetical protein
VSGPQLPGVQNGRKFLKEDLLDIIIFDKEDVGSTQELELKMDCIWFKNIS